MLNDVKATVACLILVVACVGVFAQQDVDAADAFGLVVYAEGLSVDIIRDGRRVTYQVSRDEVVGLPILTGDVVQTEQDTYLEIQLLPSQMVLKVAENTMFAVAGLEEGSAGIALTFGRLRARSQKLAEDGSFTVRAAGAIARGAGADFGFDFVADTGTGSYRIRVAAVCGSLRSGSCTRMALRTALDGAQDVGAEVALIDLRDYNLTFCDGGGGEGYPEDVERLRADLQAAHGLILGSPEYHGSFSGVIKNALDLVGSELSGKVVGLVGENGSG